MVTKHNLSIAFLCALFGFLCLSFSGCAPEPTAPPTATPAEVPSPIAKLKDEDCDVRQSAASALGEIVDRRAVEPLIATLKDEDCDVRQSAASALGQIGDKRAVQPLIATLKDEDIDVCKSAASALANIGTPALEPLIAALKDEDWRVGLFATSALGEIGDERAVEPLIAALEDYRPAASALANIGSPAVEPLIAVLKDRDSPVRLIVAETLDKMESFPKAGEDYAWCLVAQGRFPECIELGDVAVEPLIAALTDEDLRDLWSVVAALGEIGTPALEPLIVLLKDDKRFSVRRRAATALGEIGDERALEPLIAALEDGDSSVRDSAASALGEIGDERAVEPLIAAMKRGDSSLRDSAASALGEIGTPAVEPLIALLKDESPWVPDSAASALGKTGDERAVEPLIAALKGGSVRHPAVWALMEIGDKRAAEPLVGSLTDRSINTVVAKFLQKMGWKPQTKEERIHFLVGLRDPAVKDAENWPDVESVLMQDARSGRIEYALEALTKIGNESVLPELIQLIETKGTKTIAEAYLNCNHKQLRKAGHAWATSHGYSIQFTPGGVQTWNWGTW